MPDYRDIVQHQFSDYIAASHTAPTRSASCAPYRTSSCRSAACKPADLYDPPLTEFGQDAVERWFAPEQVAEMLAFAEGLAILR